MYKTFHRMLLATLAGFGIAAGAHAQPGPDAVVERYVTAVNGGDMATVRSLIAEEVARSDFVGCTAAMSNKDCLAFYIDTTVVGQHGVIKVMHSEHHGDDVHARLELRTDGTRRAGVERAVGTDVVKVRDGKIVFFRFVPDFADEQTATFFGSLGIGPRAIKH